TVVYAGPEGLAFAFRDPSPEVLAILAAWTGAGASTGAEPSADGELLDLSAEAPAGAANQDDLAPDTDDELGARRRTRPTASPLERLRGLPIPQQIKIARTGEQPTRVALERIYGKAVWEALLHNPRLSPPEVAHIARMGTLPR